MSAREIAKQQLLSLLGHAKNQDAAKAALSLMFPTSKEMLGTGLLDTADKDGSRRIGQRDFARIYFRLTPDTSIWSKTQARSLIDAEPTDAFQIFASKLDTATRDEKPKLRRLLLELLEEAMSRKEGGRSKWFIALLNNASLLLNDEGWQTAALFDLSIEDLIRTMLRQVLMASTQDERVELIKEAIANASDISLLCELMRSVSGDTEAEGMTYTPDSLGEATQMLRDILLDRVRQMAEEGVLHDQAQPGDILWYWWGTGHGEEVREYTKRTMMKEVGLRFLLQVPISYVRSTAGNYEKIDRQSWNKILDIEELRSRALELHSSSSSEMDRNIADRFLEALERNDKPRH
ncbi:hypothetical protein HFO32_25945 [Rhizobium leguminosarum]|uniref:hypothetical protein n=1 Tax=Rhizobium leguminosarum TaxID=384 RepID=UPI001C97B7C6|nr:hypothetical protein [Rhizobium leguminosarum]MBY5655694.1 hypothetical protein [Rhizobium leguminosarum]MBY5670478.1 hypothetical protein [Rhizobium leguminosarum]MBY5685543.1 hypothetical protein [Rhizobium leguminosarum]